MPFWRISCPRYPGGDYDHTFVNGEASHTYGLPGIACGVCNQTWSGSRTLPFPVPKRLVGRKELKERWPIPQDEHRALRGEVEEALATEGHTVHLRPGDRFQPALVRLPTFPEADFLWSGFGTVIVSARVRELLTSNDLRGATFCKVSWGKVGQRRPELPAPIPRGGEPESLLSQMPTYRGDEAVPSYFEMVVTAESQSPPGVIRSASCPACGREALDTSNRVLDVPLEAWTGEDLFRLRTTLYILVTETTKNLLERAGTTNLRFTGLPLGQRLNRSGT